MKTIQKQPEPAYLMQHWLSAYATFDNLQEKEQLKQDLLEEQGYLCCYCMRRIRIDNMKVEHRQSQSKYPAQRLIYKNLFAACDGGEGKPRNKQHCDTHKGDDDIVIDPGSVGLCEANIQYNFHTGIICSHRNDWNHDLNCVLNLNTDDLREARKYAVQAFKDRMWKKYPSSDWPRQVLMKTRDELLKSGEKLEPYCQVVIAYIEHKLGIGPYTHHSGCPKKPECQDEKPQDGDGNQIGEK